MSNTKIIEVVQDHEIKNGMRALFFTQIFGTLSYSIIMSSLTLFTSGVLHLSTSASLALTGSFLAFNFGLHFLGGYMGGRNISNRMLFCIGMLFQTIGCMVLYSATYSALMVGLAIFLTGSGLNVTCMNSMVTQLFTDPEDTRREASFLWNYSGMNIGFLIGYMVAGAFGKYDLYGLIFSLGGLANIVAIIIIIFNWHTVRDRDTYLTDMKGNKPLLYKQYVKATVIILVTCVAMLVLMKHSELSNNILIVVSLVMVSFAFLLPAQEKHTKKKVE